ncbi:beta-1,4-galactosyltransferase galt-1-like [Rhinophrynus dorsalis]
MKPCTSIKNLCKLFSLIFSMFTVLYLIYIVVLVKIILPLDTFSFKSTDFDATECRDNLATGTIMRVKNSRTYLIAAYLDLRGGINRVRILGITHRYEEDVLYCNFCFYDTNETILAEIQVHTDHFDFPYGTTDILCNLKDHRVAHYISVYVGGESVPTFLEVQNIKQQENNLKFEYDFLICISTLFGSYNNVLQFIQSMEMYQILGAQKVIIYHTDSSPIMKKVLSYYIEMDFLEVIPWPITSFLNVSAGWHYPEHPGDLHYYGQTAALNDCIYRHMYRSKYIALNDIDELILPAIHEEWPAMIDFLLYTNPTSNIFMFENHVFPTTLQDKSSPLTPEEWNSVPGINILEHAYREPNKPYEINPTKMIVNPRTILKTSVHVALDFIGEEYLVPSDIARLCHYREPKQKDLERDFLIEDTIMSKYENALVERVNRVLSEVDLLHNVRKGWRR